MSIKFFSLFTLFLLFIPGCVGNDPGVPGVSEISYRETSGAVSPEVSWEEVYTVSSAGVTFVRTGFSEVTSVNTGTWTINSYGTNEAQLFRDLSGSDVYNVVKTGQTMPPTDAGIQDFTVRYVNGEKREVINDGSTYNNPAVITTPINNFLAKVVLPADAVSRYKEVIILDFHATVSSASEVSFDGSISNISGNDLVNI